MKLIQVCTTVKLFRLYSNYFIGAKGVVRRTRPPRRARRCRAQQSQNARRCVLMIERASRLLAAVQEQDLRPLGTCLALGLGAPRAKRNIWHFRVTRNTRLFLESPKCSVSVCETSPRKAGKTNTEREVRLTQSLFLYVSKITELVKTCARESTRSQT